MNLADSIKHLKQIGFTVFKKGDKYDVNRNGIKEPSDYEGGYEPDMSARQVIKFASAYSTENPQSTALKKSIKLAENRKERKKTREIIKIKDSEDIDDTFSVNSGIVKENVRNWDRYY